MWPNCYRILYPTEPDPLISRLTLAMRGALETATERDYHMIGIILSQDFQ